MSKIRVAVIGAGGKMGTRTSKNLAKLTDKYDLMLVENAPKGIESIMPAGWTSSQWRRPWRKRKWSSLRSPIP